MIKPVNKIISLRRKIVIMLLFISIIPTAFIGSTSYYTSRNILNRKLETTSQQTINEITRGLDNYFSSMSNLVDIFSNDSRVIGVDKKSNHAMVRELMNNINTTDDNIINLFVGTEKGVFLADPDVELPESYDHKASSWYKTSIESPDKIHISSPYTDTGSGNLVVSISGAVKNDGQIIGVAGLDLDLSSLSSSLSDIKVGAKGYLSIVDVNGVVISNPDSSLIGTDYFSSVSYWEQIRSREQGFTTYKDKGEDYFITYGTSETGWKSIAILTETELTEDTSVIAINASIVLLAIMIIAIIIAFVFSKPISSNVNNLLLSFRQFANGNLKTSATVNSNDEFKLLSDSFNEMASTISKLINNVSDSSITVLDTSIVLSNVSEETNASINEVARAVEEVAKGATEQAQNSVDGAESIADLSMELTLIQKATEIIDSLSKDANRFTLNGLDQVEALTQKSDLTMNSSDSVTKLVFETNESMKQIDDISDTISKITEQTNLLALNASIEAARAGETGRGFAVVADEIRKLAEQSKTSTAMIKVIVEEISNKTDLSVKAMNSTNQNVKEQLALVIKTREVFQDIMAAVQTLSEKVSEIKNNISGISDKKEHIVDQIENISAISEEAASATEEVTASTEQIAATMDDITTHASELKNLSELLQEQLNIFKF